MIVEKLTPEQLTTPLTTIQVEAAEISTSGNLLVKAHIRVDGKIVLTEWLGISLTPEMMVADIRKSIEKQLMEIYKKKLEQAVVAQSVLGAEWDVRGDGEG